MTDDVSRLDAALEGRYRVERELGRGGMATVYLAQDLKHERHVAIKVLRPELASSLGAERFLREIQLSARLSHPHILTVIDSGEAGDLLYFVLPYVEGESLRERIDREERLPVAEAVRIAGHVASALGYAHEQGIVHRDIKPGNVLMHRGEPEVSDFGIAVGIHAAQDERLTSTGLSLGSPAYMSPEQATGEGTVDHRSDIYSLGSLVYEMISGEPPFTGASAQAVLAKVLTGTPNRLDEGRPDVSPQIAEAVARALEREPGARYQTAEAFAEALRGALPAQSAVPAGRVRKLRVAVAGLAAAVVALVGWMTLRGPGPDLATLAAVDAVEVAIDDRAWISAYRGALALPDVVADSTRDRLLDAATVVGTVTTDPPGARVSWRPLLEPDASWVELGATPLEARFPREEVLVRLEADGRQTRELWSPWVTNEFTWPLRPLGEEPADVLLVPGGPVSPGIVGGGIWQEDSRLVGDYLVDKFEVTNSEYRAFVEAGGYEREEYWQHALEAEGGTFSWAEAMSLFVDRTGQPGPSTWEIGSFRDGTADHPVTGVSWYEAAAFAEFTGRELPTMYHWYRSAGVFRGHYVIPLSNLGGTGVAPVGQHRGVTGSGAYDMAGNAREWVANAAGEYRLTAGGGWSDAEFAFALAQPLSPMDRSEANGFRLITDMGDSATFAVASAPVVYYERDFAGEAPASDEVFEVLKGQYAYDDAPLEAATEEPDTVSGGIVRERISFNAAYGDERMVLYLFRPPEAGAEPLQTIIYFPGSGALNSGRHFTEVGISDAPASHEIGVLARSGRAVAFPVLKSTYEREDDFVYPLQDESNDYRDHVIQWYQDLARSVDYLESRSDVDTERMGYYGTSWGGRMAPIMLALEPRLSVAVLNIAGFSPKPTQPAVDPFNFAPRVRVPTLMMNAQFDPVFPLEISARPLFNTLGSVEKEFYTTAGAHFVPWPERVEQTLGWLDRHLGPAR